MEYRRLGSAGVKVSEVGLGTWLTFGERLDEESARKVFFTALDLGIIYVDTADEYAQGRAEEMLGRFLRDVRRSSIVLSSKVFRPVGPGPNDRGLSRKHIMEAVEASLRRLGTDYLDIYFCHRHDPEVEVEEVVRAMEDLIRQGKILYWGTSYWPAEQIERAVGVAREFRAFPPKAEQPPYNMLNRGVEVDTLPTCYRSGIGVVVYSPLAGGLLTGKYNEGVPEGSRASWSEGIRRTLTEELRGKLRELTALAGELGLTPSQLALAWVLRRPEVSSAIVGATKPEHLQDNVRASGVKLEPEVLERIEEILGDRPEVPKR